jgi:GDP-L-fucose synthase
MQKILIPMNLGSDDEISIKDLANIISKLMQFDGKIEWDKSKPNGQPRRRVSNKRAKESFGFKPETNIEDGLRNTIEWFYSQNKRD